MICPSKVVALLKNCHQSIPTAACTRSDQTFGWQTVEGGEGGEGGDGGEGGLWGAASLSGVELRRRGGRVFGLLSRAVCHRWGSRPADLWQQATKILAGSAEKIWQIRSGLEVTTHDQDSDHGFVMIIQCAMTYFSSKMMTITMDIEFWGQFHIIVLYIWYSFSYFTESDMVLKGKRTLWEDAHHFSIGATQGYPHFHLDPNPHHYPTPNLHHHPGSDPHNPARFLLWWSSWPKSKI